MLVRTAPPDEARGLVTNRRGPLAGLSGIVDGARRWHLWRALAIEDVRGRFARTSIGMAWLSVSFAAFCIAKIIIFGTISNQPMHEFSAYLVLGFLAWTFINGAVVEGCGVFVGAQSWLLGTRLPQSVFVFEAVTRLCIIIAMNAAAGALIVLYLGYPKSWNALAALAALPVWWLTAIGVQFVLGIICAANRDVTQLVGTFMRIAFFVTPIIWMPAQLGVYSSIAFYNPFTHYLDIFRYPILYGIVPVTSWLIVLGVTTAISLAAVILFGRFRHRIVYWI